MKLLLPKKDQIFKILFRKWLYTYNFNTLNILTDLKRPQEIYIICTMDNVREAAEAEGEVRIL